MAGKKVQLPVVGGIRKVVRVTDPAAATANPGTTITEFANQTVSLAQLKQALGLNTKTSSNAGGGGAAAALVPGPGLSGGGVLVGAVPINLIAPIPAFIFEEGGGGGGDGDPGPPGQNGATGAVGPTGPAVYFLPDDPEAALDAVPGAVGPPGGTGAGGPMGPAVFMSADDGEDGWHAVPGPPGPPGAPGANGANGLPGPAIYMLADDPIEPDIIQSGGTAASSSQPSTVNNQPDGINVVMPLPNGTSNTNWSNYTVTVKVPGSQLLHSVNKWKLSFQVASGFVDLSSVRVLRTAAGSTTIIDTTNVAWGGVTNPTLGAGALNYSDPVALSLDPQHDYYIQYYMATTTNNTAVGLFQASAAGTFNAFTESHNTGDTRGTIPGSFNNNQSMAITQIITSGDTAGFAGTTQPDGMNLVLPATQSGTSSSWSNYTINAKISGGALLHSVPAGDWQFNFVINATFHADVTKAIIRRTLAGSTTVIDTINVTWGGITAQTLNAGQNFCDHITAYGLDPQHDYYIQIYLTTSTNNSALTVTTGSTTGIPAAFVALTGGYNSGDNTTTALGSLTIGSTLYGLGMTVLSKS